MIKRVRFLTKRRLLAITTGALVIAALLMLAYALIDQPGRGNRPESTASEPVVLTPEAAGDSSASTFVAQCEASGDANDADANIGCTTADVLLPCDSDNGGQDNEGSPEEQNTDDQDTTDQNNQDTTQDSDDADNHHDGCNPGLHGWEINCEHNVQCGHLHIWGEGHLDQTSAWAEGGFSYDGHCVQINGETGFSCEDGDFNAYVHGQLTSDCVNACFDAGLVCDECNIEGYVSSDAALNCGCINLGYESSLGWGCNGCGWYCHCHHCHGECTTTGAWGNSTSQLNCSGSW